jgi:hypothetical protein
MMDLLRQFKGTKNVDYTKNVILDTGADQGKGKGFTGNELLSKDELALIMDLEDEKVRANNFEMIYPRPSTCAHYYSYMEIKRYQNALYCAWYCTSKKVRAKLLSQVQAYHSNEINSDKSDEDESYDDEESESDDGSDGSDSGSKSQSKNN